MSDREIASTVAVIALVGAGALAISVHSLKLFVNFQGVIDSLALWKLVFAGVAAVAGFWGAMRSHGRRRARQGTIVLAALFLALV